jgi:uroporphyrinogen-III synthase
MNALNPDQGLVSTPRPLRILITRPQPQASEWVQSLNADDALRRIGAQALALPLLAITGPADWMGVAAAWSGLIVAEKQRFGARIPERPDALCWDAVVFVSPAAVDQFFAVPSGMVADKSWPAHCWAAAPGPGTLAALARHGVPATRLLGPPDDARQFDSEALWAAMGRHSWLGRRVLIVRSEGGREWLAQQLVQAGAQIDFLSAYRRCVARWGDGAHGLCERALSQPDSHLWCFSSSEAIDALVKLRPQASWAHAGAVVTHPRIAERAQAAGFGRIFTSMPTLQALSGCIQSLAV